MFFEKSYPAFVSIKKYHQKFEFSVLTDLSFKWLYLHIWARKLLHSIIKNPQILPNQADIKANLPTHGVIIFTKFHNDWVRIKNF